MSQFNEFKVHISNLNEAVKVLNSIAKYRSFHLSLHSQLEVFLTKLFSFIESNAIGVLKNSDTDFFLYLFLSKINTVNVFVGLYR